VAAQNCLRSYSILASRSPFVVRHFQLPQKNDPAPAQYKRTVAGCSCGLQRRTVLPRTLTSAAPNASRCAGHPAGQLRELRPRLDRNLLYGLDGLGGAAPALKLQLLRFQRIGCLEELLQLLDRPCRQAPNVLQVAFKG
jgi:hypothetical protein